MKGNTQIFPNSEENNSKEENTRAGNRENNIIARSQTEGQQQPFSQPSLPQSQHPCQDYSNHFLDFQQHSKIETMTPSESLVDYPNFQTNDNYAESGMGFQELQRESQEQLREEIAFLREENMLVREEMMEIRESYELAMKRLDRTRPVYSTEDVNRLVQENRALEEIQKKLTAEKAAIKREIHALQENLLEISNSNQGYYKRLVAITNELERQRRDNKLMMKECEEQLTKNVEKEQRNYTALAQELAGEREENENLRVIIYESNQELMKIKEQRDALEEECEALGAQKHQLNAMLQERDDQQSEMLREAIQARSSQISQLRQSLFSLQQQHQSLQQACQKYKHLFQSELLRSQQSSHTIKTLQKQLEQSYNQINNNKIQMQNPNCASLRRVKLLCNQSNRKVILQDLKRTIKEIGKVELENRLVSLVQELYMDAEYRQRTNLQMQEIIVQMEKKLGVLESGKDVKRVQTGKDRHYVEQLESSLDRYEQLLLAADSQKLRLVEEISILKKENYQIRLELANSSVDNQTQELIEQLTLQLEQEKHNNTSLEQENQSFREEIRSIQRELNEKNKRIKLLTLNLNKKAEGQARS